MPDLRLTVADAIRAERQRRELTQDDLAARLGWTRGVISHIETGRRPLALHEVPLICAALDVTLDRLLADATVEERRLFGL